jgi:hypothetical protein
VNPNQPRPGAPQQSNPARRAATWYANQQPALRAVLAVAAALLVMMFVCSCCASLGSLASAGSQPTSNVSQPSGHTGGPPSQPTKTPAKTPAKTTPTPASPAAPTATPQPTATPNPLDAAKKAITDALNDGKGVTLTWDAKTKTLTVEHDASDNLTNDLIKVGIKDDTFRIMKAVYTKTGLHPSAVIVHDNGPTTDKYGNSGKGPWGTATLYSTTASLFNWSGLDYESAWADYDYSWFINGL